MTAIDLFAGAGGTSEGARLAGVDVRLAANHWPAAIECHSRNHPGVEHWCQDLQQADPRLAPAHDVLLASPSCQGHSLARGRERPHHDALRSTAWAVITFAEVHRPRALVVENVPEFATRWELYRAWCGALEALGYGLSATVLDSSEFGVPQQRRRLFILGLRGRVGRVMPELRSPGLQPVPASSFLRFGDGESWSRIYTPRRSPRTLARIESARRMLGDTFLAPYYSHGSGEGGRSIDRPIGTVTCRARWALVAGDRMRMLTVPELRAAMGFRSGYWLPESPQATAIQLLGNAVCPPVAQHVIELVSEWV